MSILHQITEAMKIRFRQQEKDLELDFKDLAYHTDQVKPGSCFVAIRGFKSDGHRFVEEAVKRGATTVVVEKKMSLPKTVMQVVVEDSRDSLARLSALFFAEPSRELSLVGVTGTNGKTTIVYLLEEILRADGKVPGIWTTVVSRYPNYISESSRTTPESYDLQKFLRGCAAAGVSNGFVEVTSHAVELKRAVGCHFDGGIFTNLTPEHLDFHGDMEKYFAAKEAFFTERLVVSEKPNVWAVINYDDPYGRRLAKELSLKTIRYSLKEPVELYGKVVRSDLQGTSAQIDSSRGHFEISSPLVGNFNMQNILAAIGGAIQLGVPLSSIQRGVVNFRGAPGRLMRVENKKNLSVFVDYAHTPNALENVLSTLKPLTQGKLIVVFGCGGDRDTLKRPLMGGAVAHWADTIVVTSDNPRTEDPEKIMEEIIPGISKTGKRDFLRIVDRKGAIQKALELAGPKDCVLVAGKGHERFQEIQGARLPFDDAKVIRELLA